jgi:hypothetical protein
MPRALDPRIAKVLKEYEIDPSGCWDCHGVWVVKHSACEELGAKAGVKWGDVRVLAHDDGQKAIAVFASGTLGERSEWSIGEAAPGNNKNAYPWAMAEKRVKDRLILKLVGLHGVAYSEDESDDFKERDAGTSPPPPPAVDLEREHRDRAARIRDAIDGAKGLTELNKIMKDYGWEALDKAIRPETALAMVNAHSKTAADFLLDRAEKRRHTFAQSSDRKVA